MISAFLGLRGYKNKSHVFYTAVKACQVFLKAIKNEA